MTALDKDRKTTELLDGLESHPVAAATIIYAGSIVAKNTAGNAVPASASITLKVVGVAQRQVDNSDGDAGDLRVETKSGKFFFDSGTGADAIADDDAGKICYASDDHTVNLTDGAGLRPAVGTIKGVDPVTGQVAVAIPEASLYALTAESVASDTSYLARGMGPAADVADLGAFTVASNDGLTYVAGDVVVLYAQTTKAQDGPYVVGTVGAGVAPLTRPSWWATGDTLVSKRPIEVRAGTLFGGTTWKSTAASGVVGTDDPALYPRIVTLAITLSSGVFAVTTVPIKSATKTQFVFSRTTAGTPTDTLEYSPTSITPGALGTASVTAMAQVAAGTVNASDTSVGNFSIINQI